MYKFTKSIRCSPEKNKSDLQCGSILMTKLEARFGIKLHADTAEEKVNGHISVSHGTPHIFWVWIYSHNGIHESMRGTEIIEQRSDRVIKFNGTFPTQSEVENV